jgi:hypothetical protein
MMTYRSDMTHTEKIDAALETMLVVMALKLDDYKRYPVTLGRMRAAMLSIMANSYVQGSNDAIDAMKGK